METLVIQTEGDKLLAIKAFLQELKVNFETKSVSEESSYNAEFVKKVEESIAQANEGKVRTVMLDEIWK
ncbi:MAG TPA: hypothetical protein PKD51_04790 [Saprospiraceae bacterium]|nr:hypothetical protein [Saprospiraceae bacterium]HMU03121.1 hypothetical protein [Saprospiraceae bacterium]